MAEFKGKSISETITISAGPTGEVRITAMESEGKKYIDVRKWYCTQKNPVMNPGKGVWIPVEQVDEVVSAVKAIKAELEGK